MIALIKKGSRVVNISNGGFNLLIDLLVQNNDNSYELSLPNTPEWINDPRNGRELKLAIIHRLHHDIKLMNQPTRNFVGKFLIDDPFNHLVIKCNDHIVKNDNANYCYAYCVTPIRLVNDGDSEYKRMDSPEDNIYITCENKGFSKNSINISTNESDMLDIINSSKCDILNPTESNSKNRYISRENKESE